MTDLLKATEEYVRNKFERSTSENLSYHNLSHTQDVVNAAIMIGQKTTLTEKELVILQLAAWFHDIGYLKSYRKHEEESARLARNFFMSENLNNEFIEQVASAILSTKIPQQPKTNVERVLCDADMYHLSKDDFMNISFRLMEELNAITELNLSESEYCKLTICFFESHHYHTKFGREILSKGKKKNRQLLCERVKK